MSEKEEKKMKNNENEEIEDSDEKKELVVKKDIEISEKALEKIGEEIKKQTTIPKEKQKKINKIVFKNIMIAIGIVLYFIFINLGFHRLAPQTYLKDLQVFSMTTIGITVIIFEIAYKKDSGEIAIYGIESLAVSIWTLMTIYIGAYHNDKFSYIINLIAILFSVYYVGKAIVIYTKMRKKALKRVSDIDKIRRVK